MGVQTFIMAHDACPQIVKARHQRQEEEQQKQKAFAGHSRKIRM
jgi:hypothetical protein